MLTGIEETKFNDKPTVTDVDEDGDRDRNAMMPQGSVELADLNGDSISEVVVSNDKPNKHLVVNVRPNRVNKELTS